MHDCGLQFIDRICLIHRTLGQRLCAIRDLCCIGGNHLGCLVDLPQCMRKIAHHAYQRILNCLEIAYMLYSRLHIEVAGSHLL